MRVTWCLLSDTNNSTAPSDPIRRRGICWELRLSIYSLIGCTYCIYPIWLTNKGLGGVLKKGSSPNNQVDSRKAVDSRKNKWVAYKRVNGLPNIFPSYTTFWITIAVPQTFRVLCKHLPYHTCLKNASIKKTTMCDSSWYPIIPF